MTEADRTVRAFVAVELPDAVLEYLGRVQRLLAEAAPHGVAWVRPEGMHLTLKFLGNVHAQRIAPVGERLAAVASRGHPCRLRTAPLGMFPSPRRIRVIWAGVEGDLDALIALQRDVESSLATLGFAAEAREFRGHITLGRVRDDVSPADLQHLAAAAKEHRVPPLPIPVTALTLFESHLSRTGARYIPLAVLPLRPD